MVSAEVLSVEVLVVVCGSGGGGGVQALPQVALAPVRVLCKAHFKVRRGPLGEGPLPSS